MILFLAAAVCGLATFTFTLQSIRAWALKELTPGIRFDIIGWRLLDLILTIGTFTLIIAGRFEASMLYLVASLFYSFSLMPRLVARTIAEGVIDAEARAQAEEKP